MKGSIYQICYFDSDGFPSGRSFVCSKDEVDQVVSEELTKKVEFEISNQGIKVVRYFVDLWARKVISEDGVFNRDNLPKNTSETVKLLSGMKASLTERIDIEVYEIKIDGRCVSDRKYYSL